MMKNIPILFAFMILSCILAGCGDNSATIVFTTDISNGYGKINPTMSITYIVGAEDDKLNDMIKTYYDANSLFRYRQKTQKTDYINDEKPVVDLSLKIGKYIEANPRVMNKRYLGNRFELTGVSVGSTLYCCSIAKWNNGANAMFWIKKIVVKPGENQIILEYDYSAMQWF